MVKARFACLEAGIRIQENDPRLHGPGLYEADNVALVLISVYEYIGEYLNWYGGFDLRNRRCVSEVLDNGVRYGNLLAVNIE
jgi:hypothetical protein